LTISTCWQYKVKQDISCREGSFIPDYDIASLKIIPIPWDMARDFIVTYEWVGNMGTSKYCYGLFLSDKLASVVCYGPLVAPTHYARIFGKAYSKSILQLCRGATTYWAPKWAPSKLISTSLKILNHSMGIRLVLGYADPIAGEIGTIYQACNALYLGKTDPGRGKKYIINGHLYDPRKVHKKFGTRAHIKLLEIDANYKTLPIAAKHRYLFFLGSKQERNEIKEKLTSLVFEYPKRDIV